MNSGKQTRPSTEQSLPAIIHQSELSAVPDYISAEVFLENSGFFTPSSKRVKGIYTKEKVIREKVDPDGTTRIVATKISANYELGLPITSDFDYYRAFLKICDELVDREGRFRLPILIPTRQLIRYAGKVESPKERQEAKRWFERMTGTLIKGGLYRAKHKDYDDGFVGTVFSQVILRGNVMKNGKTAETNYIWPSPWFLSNYFYRHLKSIDFNLHQRLRKPIAKALYPLLETGWYASGGKPYAKSYFDLCQEFLLVDRQHISRIKEQLDPSHDELVRERFLATWEYRKAANQEHYIVTYWPGHKFFEDQQAREMRRQLAEQLTQQSGKYANPAPAVGDAVELHHEAPKLLVRCLGMHVLPEGQGQKPLPRPLLEEGDHVSLELLPHRGPKGILHVRDRRRCGRVSLHTADALLALVRASTIPEDRFQIPTGTHHDNYRPPHCRPESRENRSPDDGLAARVQLSRSMESFFSGKVRAYA